MYFLFIFIINFSLFTKCFSLGTFCKWSGECAINETCFDYQCKCKPNYYNSSLSSPCLYNICKYDPECILKDPNRICDIKSHSCECKSGFIPDRYTTKCVKKCTILSCGPHEYCSSGVCYCDSNYKRNVKTQQCDKFSCNNDVDCYINDWNSHCSSHGVCTCDTNYYKDSTNLCVRSYKTSVWVWVWVFFIIPVGIAIGIAYCIRRRRMLAHHHHHQPATITVVRY
jgi:hypothetical protein